MFFTFSLPTKAISPPKRHFRKNPDLLLLSDLPSHRRMAEYVQQCPAQTVIGRTEYSFRPAVLHSYRRHSMDIKKRGCLRKKVYSRINYELLLWLKWACVIHVEQSPKHENSPLVHSLAIFTIRQLSNNKPPLDIDFAVLITVFTV